MNSEIRKFEEDLIAIYNSSKVPAEAKRLVISEVLRKAEMESNRIISAERSKRKTEEGKNEQSV